MPTPLLSTKFFIPRPRNSIVLREQLFEMLRKGSQGKLTLISAPAGYGKTTLITSWLATQELPVGWFSVDAGDNNCYHFFSYFLTALHKMDLRVGSTLLQMLQSPMPPLQDVFVELLLNEITSFSQECILVIDDYHLINNSVIHTIFRQVIENSPKELHIIICSRAELPFSVSKLRSSDELLELTQKELSLTLSECVSYMNIVMKAQLQKEDIAILRERTEGWLAGMQLAALSLRVQSDKVGFINSLKGDNRYIGDYLVDEVLLHTPANLQDFLLQTSILDRMDASLCNYVLQIENSHELLDSIDKRRLFITPLDENRKWFRYHHLFREMLFTRLTHKSPEIFAELYARASDWYAAENMKEEAADYALDGKDYSRAAVLIKEIGLPLLGYGRWKQLLNWFDRIPETEFQKQYGLWSTYFMTMINAGLIASAAKKIDQLYLKDLEALGASDNEINIVRGELAAVKGVLTLHSKANPLQAKESLKVAREYLSGDVSFRRVFANNNYGVSCLFLGEVENARKIFEQNVAWGKTNRFSLSRVMGTSYLADAIAMSGDLQMAHELFQDTVRYVHEIGLQHGAVFSKANLGLGNLYYEWNKLAEAKLVFIEGVRLAEQGGYLDQLLPGCAALARIQILQGDLPGVQATIQRARAMADKYDNPADAISYINAIEADMAHQRGAHTMVDNWLIYRKYNSSSVPSLFWQYEQTTLARVLAAKEEYNEMGEVIKPVWELALRQKRTKDIIFCEVIMAKCLFMKGEPLPAMAILQKALFQAAPNKFVRTFLDEGMVVISMIKQLLNTRGDRKPNSEECPTDYLYFLLDQVGKDTLEASTDGATASRARTLSKSSEGMEPLTDQELHILPMLEAGYPNKQIAQKLNISSNTVKYHLKNIFGKLGVVNRTQAARIIRKEAQ